MPLGARAQAGQPAQLPRPSPPRRLSPGLGPLWGSRSPGPPDRSRPQATGGGCRPLECSARAEPEEGAGRAGGSARGLPISMRPRAARPGNRSPRTARAGQPRAQRAPLLPQVAARTRRARTRWLPGGEPRAPGALGRPGPAPAACGRVPRCSQVRGART